MGWIFWPDEEWHHALQQAADERVASDRTSGQPFPQPENQPSWTPFPHQLETARHVVDVKSGRAILADEVGLGKTIEAGLILQELILRGSVCNALILCPSSLVFQWARELNEKFRIAARVYRKPFMWDHCPYLVTTLETAKKEPNRTRLLSKTFDLLIVDEAHQLKNPDSKNHQFVRELRKKHCLLLTATPVQNAIRELYYLSDLLRPGHWSDPAVFNEQYSLGKRGVKNEGQLQRHLESIWVRNRRSECGLHLPSRHIHHLPVELGGDEQILYDALTGFVRERLSKNNQLSLIMMQREVCSSRDALFISLANRFGKLPQDDPERTRIWELIGLIKNTGQSSKSKALIDLIRQRGGKFAVFTAFRATQEHLMFKLQEAGITTAGFYGRMKRSKRDWMIDRFRGSTDVLVATDAGSEGLNLQHCHQIVNYDLPWNPMRIEQRIGRVHRIGQQHPVHVFHLVVKNTIESYIMDILMEKEEMIRKITGPADAVIIRKEEKAWIKTWISDWIKQLESPVR